MIWIAQFEKDVHNKRALTSSDYAYSLYRHVRRG